MCGNNQPSTAFSAYVETAGRIAAAVAAESQASGEVPQSWGDRVKSVGEAMGLTGPNPFEDAGVVSLLENEKAAFAAAYKAESRVRLIGTLILLQTVLDDAQWDYDREATNDATINSAINTMAAAQDALGFTYVTGGELAAATVGAKRALEAHQEVLDKLKAAAYRVLDPQPVH